MMFKKAISIFLIPIVLLCSTGFTIFADYCPMKKESTYSFAEDKPCCCTNSNGENNCCQSSKITIKKIENGYVSSQVQVTPQQFYFAVVEYPLFAEQLFSNPVFQGLYIKKFHPPDPPVSLSILYRSILI